MGVRVLLLTYSFPPVASAEAFVTAKALGGLRPHGFDVTVLTITPEMFGMAREKSLLPYIRTRFSQIHYLAAPKHLQLRVLSSWLRPVKWLRRACVPDPFVFTNALFMRALKSWFIQDYDLLVTRSPYHSIHLVGRRLKAIHPHLRWLAHFSDPWADNPYDSATWWSRRVNRALEQRVIEAADMITVTSSETRSLVFRKYAPAVLDRVVVVPHAYDPALYSVDPREPSDGDPITIRYLGAFYTLRVPDVLLSVLRKVTARSPHLLQGVRFEFYSRFPDGASQFSRPPGLPPGLWESREPVDYLASLRLMQEADGLLTLDAPFAPSVFLPSKLIDYVGARKPIWSISPPGAATELTRSVGGWVSDPRDPCAVESVLLEFIQTLRRQRLSRASFCDENARESYSIGNVSETLAHAIRSRLFQSPRSHRFTGDA